MADFVFNNALGRVHQLAKNVDDNSPVAAVLRIHAWVNTAADGAARDADTVSALEAVTNVAEASNTGYANLSLDDTDITITVDDTNDRVDIDIADQTFTAISAGDNWTDIPHSYDDDGTDTDTATETLTQQDFVVTPNGGDITVQYAAAGWFRAA